MGEELLYKVTIEGELKTWFVVATSIAEAFNKVRVFTDTNEKQIYASEIAGTDTRRLNRLLS